MRRSLSAVLAVGLVLAAAAAAAVAPVFTKTIAHPGERVGVIQPVRIGKPLHGPTGIIVYLVPLADMVDGVRDGPPPASLTHYRLGELVGDRHGYWRLWFVVPRVKPGRYTTLVWCKPCGGSNYPHGSVFTGGVFAPGGDLHIKR